MVILVLNCGSSSIKYQVLDMNEASDYTLLARGLVERIGLEKGILTHRVPERDKHTVEEPIPTHTEGIKMVLSLLIDPKLGVLKSLEEIDSVGHRVAHGGEYFKESSLIDERAIEEIEKLCELAPLHNPANLLGIRAVLDLMPTIPQVAVFDTSFHQTMPEHAYVYPLPYRYYTEYKIRKYGFHGTSHKFVSEKAAKLFSVPLEESKIITCHLGNGSSITAVKGGKSVDTTMGFTPLEGMIMGTRSGDIDPGIVTYLQEKEGLTAQEVNSVLNKESGLMGVYGSSSDCRDLEAAAKEGDERARLALDILYYRVLKFIGSYAAVMDGVDMIVFTGGIGENDINVREKVAANLGYLGVDFDPEANRAARGEDKLITKPNSKVKIAVVTTDEELVIAQDTMRLTSEK